MGKAYATVCVRLLGISHNLFGTTSMWNIKVIIHDIYDFKLNTNEYKLSELKSIIVKYINNYLGYYPQEWNILIPYNWVISLSFPYLLYLPNSVY